MKRLFLFSQIIEWLDHINCALKNHQKNKNWPPRIRYFWCVFCSMASLLEARRKNQWIKTTESVIVISWRRENVQIFFYGDVHISNEFCSYCFNWVCVCVWVRVVVPCRSIMTLAADWFTNSCKYKLIIAHKWMLYFRHFRLCFAIPSLYIWMSTLNGEQSLNASRAQIFQKCSIHWEWQRIVFLDHNSSSLNICTKCEEFDSINPNPT